MRYTKSQRVWQLVGEAASCCRGLPGQVRDWHITVSQAAEVWGVSRSYAYRLLQALVDVDLMARRETNEMYGTANEYYLCNDLRKRVQGVIRDEGGVAW